jgi:hypothetical protein
MYKKHLDGRGCDRLYRRILISFPGFVGLGRHLEETISRDRIFCKGLSNLISTFCVDRVPIFYKLGLKCSILACSYMHLPPNSENAFKKYLSSEGKTCPRKDDR